MAVRVKTRTAKIVGNVACTWPDRVDSVHYTACGTPSTARGESSSHSKERGNAWEKPALSCPSLYCVAPQFAGLCPTVCCVSYLSI